jgi:methyl-accepting chemotaxis protein
MAGKGLGLGHTHGNGNGASHAAGSTLSRSVAAEFDRSKKKTSYVDDIPVPVIVMDCDHTVEYMNRAAAWMAGTAPEACVGLMLWDVFDNEDCRNGSCIAALAMREGRTVAGPGNYAVKGHNVPVRVFASPRYDKHNKIIGCVQVMQDDAEETRFANEISRLVKASLDGQLHERGKFEDFHGRYRDLMVEINKMLDAVIGPLNVTADYVERISTGNIPAKITDNYNGDFNKIKNNLNRCIEAVGALVADAGMLAKAGMDGRLEARADASKHQGDFRKIVEGINQAFETIAMPLVKAVEHLDKLSRGIDGDQVTKVYKGELQLLADSFNKVFASIDALVADSTMLAKAGAEGKLDARADVTKHQGEFRKIVQGFNSTLDSVVVPMQDVGEVLTKLAGGDFTAEVTNKYPGDYEHLTHAVNTLSQSVRSALGQIGRNVASIAASAEELNKVSQSMGSNADETATQASVVAAAADQVSKNVQTVATGADEMGASIREIAKSTAEATRVAASAVRTAESTNQTISKLGQSSAEIGQVIKVITSIAQQTNLLALNATIEAARAGEAGKGFAVVANEVKELAKETAKATEDISRKIAAIQTDSSGAVSAIGQISNVIGQISDIQSTIASAIEEQSATTNEIGRTLAEAAKGSTDITKNIGGVAEAAHSTTVGAIETLKSAHTLEKMAAELQTLVGKFRY